MVSRLGDWAGLSSATLTVSASRYNLRPSAVAKETVERQTVVAGLTH